MIDDFEVPGDAGCGFGDCGPGTPLTAEYFPDEVLTGRRRFYPSLPSSEETGAHRGSCVIVGPDLPESELSTLRPA
jgi:hypothetical protein